MNPKVVYLVVMCITLVSMSAGAAGAWLTSKGYQGGELLIGTCGTGLGGLIALLSSTRSTTSSEAASGNATLPSPLPLPTVITNTQQTQ